MKIKSFQEKILVLGIILTVVALIVGVVFSFFQVGSRWCQPVSKLPTIVSPSARLFLTTASSEFKVSEEFEIGVNFLVERGVATGVEGIINFNPEILQVVDSDRAEEGVQVRILPVFEKVLVNSVDNEKGQITFSTADWEPERKGQEAGGVATITFKAKSIGLTKIEPVFYEEAPYGERESHVIAFGGKDLLKETESVMVKVVE